MARSSNLCWDIIERKYVFRRRREEKLRFTVAVEVPNVMAINRHCLKMKLSTQYAQYAA